MPTVTFYRLFTHILNTKHNYAYQVISVIAKKKRCFMLISRLSTSLVLQTFLLIFLLSIFFFLILYIFETLYSSLNFQVPLGYMRRLGAEYLIPLDLEIEETLRRIWRDKIVVDQLEHQPMDNIEDFKEEEVGSRIGDGVTSDTTQMDNVLRPIKDYAHPLSTTQPVIRRPTI